MAIEWIERAIKLTGEGVPFSVITVCAVDGSAPRDVGTKMIVTDDQQWGTIGGGALEFAATAHARAMLSPSHETFQFEAFPLGPALGQCCGGRVLLSYEKFTAPDHDWLSALRAATSDGESATIERAIPVGTWKITDTTESKNRNAVVLLTRERETLDQRVTAQSDIAAIRETISDGRIPVYLFGAGHVGGAILQYLRALPVSVTWVDRRGESIPDSATENIKAITTDQETEVVTAAPSGACFFVMTHDHQLDYDLVLKVLQRGDSAYCGLIGSVTKRARFEKRLLRADVSGAQIEHLHCPIGSTISTRGISSRGIDSKLPAIIALAAVHEMLLAYQTYTKGDA